MKIEKESAKFKCYCRLMYSENCTERMDHGQVPYPSLEAYVTKNYDFIVNKYKGGLTPWLL
jgi:hypothetical protein